MTPHINETDDATTDELPRSLADFPDTIEGGDYGGAELIGVIDGDRAEYHDGDLGKIVVFRLLADHVPEIAPGSQTGRDLKWVAEESLDGMTVAEHIETTEREFADYDALDEARDG